MTAKSPAPFSGAPTRPWAAFFGAKILRQDLAVGGKFTLRKVKVFAVKEMAIARP